MPEAKAQHGAACLGDTRLGFASQVRLVAAGQVSAELGTVRQYMTQQARQGIARSG